MLHGSPPTVTEPWGLRIEVGAPGHMVRHVLVDADDAAIRELAGSVTVPTTSIKAFRESAELGRLLTPDWTPDPPGCLMAAALRPSAARITGDYRVTVEHARGITSARVTTGDGTIAASGQVAVTGETCVFDQIETAPGHRRRGLGSAVMAALTTSATGLGAATGILNATVQGRALYEALSWTAIGPLSSFVYQPSAVSAGVSGA